MIEAHQTRAVLRSRAMIEAHLTRVALTFKVAFMFSHAMLYKMLE
jgi:hypothetical protein